MCGKNFRKGKNTSVIFELKRESSRLVLKKWEDDREVFTLKQVHSSKVHMIDSVGKKLEGDAIITQERGLKIGVRTADCVPVALLGKRTVAVIHAGWRGLKEGIVERTLEKLSKLEPLSGFLAFVGPSAKACCYEVGEEFKEHFLCIHYKNNRHYMDTQEETLLRLKRSGVEDIFLYKLCTVCNHKFPSHRRNGTKERLLTYAELLSE